MAKERSASKYNSECIRTQQLFQFRYFHSMYNLTFVHIMLEFHFATVKELSMLNNGHTN